MAIGSKLLLEQSATTYDSPVEAGKLLVKTDEKALYVDADSGERVRISDVIAVDSLDALVPQDGKLYLHGGKIYLLADGQLVNCIMSSTSGSAEQIVSGDLNVGGTITAPTIVEDGKSLSLKYEPLITSVISSTDDSLSLQPHTAVKWEPAGDCSIALGYKDVLAWARYDIAYAEIILSLASGASLTVDSSIILVDDVTDGAVNHLVVKYYSGKFRIYVVDVEE